MEEPRAAFVYPPTPSVVVVDCDDADDSIVNSYAEFPNFIDEIINFILQLLPKAQFHPSTFKEINLIPKLRPLDSISSFIQTGHPCWHAKSAPARIVLTICMKCPLCLYILFLCFILFFYKSTDSIGVIISNL